MRRRPASTAFDVHMTDLQAGPRAARRLPGLRRLRRLQLRRHAGRRRRLGALASSSTRSWPTQFAAFFAAPDTFALGVCNGCQMMAALAAIIPGAEAWPRFTAQPQRAVRGAAVAWWRCCRSPEPVLRRHGRQPPADRGGARRGLCRLLAARRRGARAARAMRFVDNHGQPTEALPGQPERQPRRPDRRDHRRRPLHGADAAPRARVPQRADELDAGARSTRPARGCGCSTTRGAAWAEAHDAPGLRSARSPNHNEARGPGQASRHGSGFAGPSADGPLGGVASAASLGASFQEVRDEHVQRPRGVCRLDTAGLRALHGADAVRAVRGGHRRAGRAVRAAAGAGGGGRHRGRDAPARSHAAGRGDAGGHRPEPADARRGRGARRCTAGRVAPGRRGAAAVRRRERRRRRLPVRRDVLSRQARRLRRSAARAAARRAADLQRLGPDRAQTNSPTW